MADSQYYRVWGGEFRFEIWGWSLSESATYSSKNGQIKLARQKWHNT